MSRKNSVWLPHFLDRVVSVEVIQPKLVLWRSSANDVCDQRVLSCTMDVSALRETADCAKTTSSTQRCDGRRVDGRQCVWRTCGGAERDVKERMGEKGCLHEWERKIITPEDRNTSIF